MKAKYTWLADGTKLRARDTSGRGFDYVGSLTYNSTGLEHAQFSHGVIRAGQGSGSTSNQEINYHLTDHLGSVRSVINGSGAVREKNDYYAFGAKHTRPDYPQNTNRFDFNGKESQDALGLSFLDYGARMYDAELGRWFTQDPLMGDFLPFSPYNYTLNNPLLFTDPTGMSPVYNYRGEFLGTDYAGLQGLPIFMDDKDFYQGMTTDISMQSNEDAWEETLGDGMQNFWVHYSTLSLRPDWDGYLTLEEANEWYRNGNGEPLFVDASQIDLSPVTTGDFKDGRFDDFNFASPSNANWRTGLVYGNIKLTLMNINTGKVRLGGANGLLDNYGFEKHEGGSTFRNFATMIGRMNAGNGTPYNIYNYNYGRIKVK